MRRLNGDRRKTALAALAGAGAVAVCALALSWTPFSSGAMPEAQAEREDPVPAVAERARPAVVQVLTTVFSKDARTGETAETEYGSGSGVYIDTRGYIVTNKHVIDGGERVYVLTLSGERFPAEVRGSDDGTDIAVLRVQGDWGAQPVTMGDSDALRVGQTVIAIGNPGGGDGSVLFGTLTTGVVSALDRTEMSAGNFTRAVSVIQTDAAINSGNSGGALLNAEGELIGIPTLKLMFDSASVYEGLGFAIPINTVRPVVEELIAYGRVSRPRLGIGAVAVEGGTLEGDAPTGVQIRTVEAGGPADEAGLRPFDIITHADGTNTATIQALTAVLDSHTEGETVRLTVARCYSADGRALGSCETFSVDAAVRAPR